VVNTRSTRGGSQIWRRRRCADCGKVITTYERQDLSFIQVVSSSKNSPYSRSVLFISILRVIDAEHLSGVDVDNIVDTIEQKIILRGQSEISADLIRRLCLETLKAVDVNAFMRYMALHMRFRTKSDVKAEIKKY
jgi:transcriptional repressor NrdR